MGVFTGIEIESPTLDSTPWTRLLVYILPYLFFWVTWVLWRFVVHPRLYPEEPRTYPYLIPFIGHTIPFFRDAQGTVNLARRHFGNVREPFKLVIMGETVYVITSAQDTAMIYKSEHFSMDPWVNDLMHQFGASQPSVKAMFSALPVLDRKGKPPIDPEVGLHNWHDKPLKEVCVLLFRIFLNPGHHSETILQVLLDTVHTRMSWNEIPEEQILDRHRDSCTVSLLKWSQYVLLEGATRSFFGKALLELEPKLFDSFYQFDDSSWKLPYNIPEIFAKDVVASKAVAVQALEKYFDLPKERRSDASRLIQEIESAMRAGGIGSADIGMLVLLFYWVINANAWKASFWMLAEILNNDDLRRTISAEIDPLVSSDAPCSLSSDGLANHLQNCPTLVAVYHESLRVTSASTSVRFVLKDTYIGRLKLRKGARMIIPYRQMMLDETIYGKESHQFNHERFLKDPGLQKSVHYKPFGGGATLCPGRALAQKEVLTFVALALRKFQVKLPDDELKAKRLPKMNTRTPCIGIMGPVAGEDMIVTVSKPLW